MSRDPSATPFRAVLWKEAREQFLRGGRPTVSIVIMVVMDLLLAVVLPVGLGLGAPPELRFVAITGSLYLGMAFVGYTSLMLPFSVVVDTVAGERERHTLETLLTSPASDRDIVLGKACAILLGVAAHVGFFLVAAWATATILLGPAGLLAYLPIAIALPVIAFLTSTYTIGLGIFLSCRAPTIKQGQQWLSFSMMPFFVLPGLGSSLVPALLRGASPIEVLIVLAILAAVVFIGLNALFWTLAVRRFQRPRLIIR